MVSEAGSIHCKKKWPPRSFKLADYLKFLKLGLTEMTTASGRRPCVRAVYPSLAVTVECEANEESQLVTEHDQRRSVTERQIHTFKNQFISKLAGTDPDFPLYILENWYPNLN